VNNISRIIVPVASLTSRAAKFFSANSGTSRAVFKEFGSGSFLVSEESARSEKAVDHKSKENSNKDSFHFGD